MSKALDKTNIINQLKKLDFEIPNFNDVFDEADEYIEKKAKDIGTIFNLKFTEHDILIFKNIFRIELTLKNKSLFSKTDLFTFLINFIELRLLTSDELSAILDKVNQEDSAEDVSSYGSKRRRKRECQAMAQEIGILQGAISSLNERFNEQCRVSEVDREVESHDQNNDPDNLESSNFHCLRMLRLSQNYNSELIDLTRNYISKCGKH